MPRVLGGASRAVAVVRNEAQPAQQLGLFGEVVDVSSLRRERAALAAALRAPATERAYASDWSDFGDWCAAADRLALPASADTVGLYLVHLVRAGRSVATVARRCSAIAGFHAAGGHASPIGDEVRELLACIRRRLGVAPRLAKAALSLGDLRRMVDASGDGVLCARDRAVLLLGFASGLRRSEISALDIGDVDQVAAGLVVRLRRSKTDQEGRGRELGIPRGRRVATCPVRAVSRWLRQRGEAAGPLFFRGGLDGRLLDGERLSGAGVAMVVQRLAAAVGLDASRYGGHSLRAGLATAAAELGASDRAIMGRTGHSSSEMVGRYVRHGSLFASDPLRGAL